MKKSVLAVTLGILLVVAMAVPVLAAPMIGTRAMSMGGATIAVVNDGTAPYWNPAGMSLHVFSFTGDTAIQTDLSALSDIWPAIESFDFQNLSTDSINQLLQQCATAIGPEGISGNADSYLAITTRWVGISAYGHGEASVYNLAYDSANNVTTGNVDIKGTGEIALSGSLRFKRIPVGEWLAIGLNVKQEYVYENLMAITYNGTDQIQTATISNAQGYAFDAGLMLQATKSLRVGATVRNLGWNVQGTTDTIQTNMTTGTETTLSSGEPYLYPKPITLDLGAAFLPFKSTTIAADVHGINLSDLSSTSEMSVHLGAEQKLGPFALRLGAMTPVQNPDFTFTGGVGYMGLIFKFDLGASYQISTGLGYKVTLAIKI